MKHSKFELILLNRIKHSGLPKPTEEYVFFPGRRWRFDFAYPDKMVAIECEGGVFSGGRHTRGTGFIKDCEKYNAAVMMGWRVLRYTTQTIDMAIDDIRKLLLH